MKLSRSLMSLLAIAPVALSGASAPAIAAPAGEKTLDDYRHFRALVIDLAGRMPSRAEVEAFGRPDFDLDKWIDQHLEGSAYAERLERVWMDALRLELSPAIQFRPPANSLQRVTIQAPDGSPMYVWYRQGQRRAREATDGEFCLTEDEVGQQFTPNQAPKGSAKPVSKKALDENTVLVKPWWLYRDYRNDAPLLRYREGWSNVDPAYVLDKDLLTEPDLKTEATAIRVCKEEAQSRENGTVLATGRKRPPGGTPPPYGRLRPLPLDEPYATQHKGEPIACSAGASLSLAADCGCGVGLERCFPNERIRAFTAPSHAPLGMDAPFDLAGQSYNDWIKLWWAQEARHFFETIFRDDRDFREVLTGKWTSINGPLAQFYRGNAAQTAGRAKAFGLLDDGVPLLDPSKVPTDLLPHDASTWTTIADRGPNAAGILTMPVYLEKYASRRARGATLYTAFLCKSFVASNVELKPSTETNLMTRPGCSTCHATLEPLAAYFSRVGENDWRYLPAASFPLENNKCKKDKSGNVPGFCRGYYDPAFSTDAFGTLAGAYASHAHAESGAVGAAQEITANPDFAHCVTERTVSSFLGRALSPDDGVALEALTQELVSHGFRTKALVRAIVRSALYRGANNWSSSTWRTGGAK